MCCTMIYHLAESGIRREQRCKHCNTVPGSVHHSLGVLTIYLKACSCGEKYLGFDSVEDILNHTMCVCIKGNFSSGE